MKAKKIDELLVQYRNPANSDYTEQNYEFSQISDAVSEIEAITKIKLLKRVCKTFDNPNLRLGQHIFNVAYSLFPKETDEISGTKFDCFYKNNKIKVFYRQLKKLITVYNN